MDVAHALFIKVLHWEVVLKQFTVRDEPTGQAEMLGAVDQGLQGGTNSRGTGVCFPVAACVMTAEAVKKRTALRKGAVRRTTRCSNGKA